MWKYRHGRSRRFGLVEQRLRARPHREHAREQVDGLADRVRVRVRTVVLRPAALPSAHHGRLRPLVVQRDREVRVRLVVAVADVVARLVLLDQRVLEQQRLHLAGHDDPLDAARGGHQRLRPREQRRRRAEVVRDALADAPRLADVQDAAVAVAEQVDARTVRERGQLRPLTRGEVDGLESRSCARHRAQATCGFRDVETARSAVTG